MCTLKSAHCRDVTPDADSLKKYCLAAGDFAQFMKDLIHQSTFLHTSHWYVDIIRIQRLEQ